ncbi:MAG: hypothetical protein V3W44_10965 [Dehalococcoidales bacterium]
MSVTEVTKQIPEHEGSRCPECANLLPPLPYEPNRDLHCDWCGDKFCETMYYLEGSIVCKYCCKQEDSHAD